MEPSTPAPTVAVRPARPAEAPLLADLAAKTFPDACPPEMPEADVLAFIETNLSEDAFARYLADSRYLVLLALTAESPATVPLGYTLLDTDPEEEPPSGAGPISPDESLSPRGPGPAYLSKMYVLDSARGTGAAVTLMTATLQRARLLGHRQVWLGVNRANARAGAFYEKLGFAVVGQRSFPVGRATGYDDLRLIDLT